MTDFLSRVKTTGGGRPNIVVLHGVEGIGKSSFGAALPKPVFGLSTGETGIQTLIDSGQCKPTAHFPEWQSWQDVIDSIRELIDSDHEYKSLVIDTINGVERLCHEHVCRVEFKNDWSKSGFLSFATGYDVSLTYWREFLNLLDELRTRSKVSILLLCHTTIRTFQNPEGADFDRYQPDLHRKTWALTSRFADMVLFANYYTEVVEEGVRKKGKGGQERVLYTERHAAYDAKNRHGLPESISMGSTGADGWANFLGALKGAKNR